MLRSRSAAAARSLSLGASAQARRTSSAPLGMVFVAAVEESVSTALMHFSPFYLFLLFRHRLGRSVGWAKSPAVLSVAGRELARFLPTRSGRRGPPSGQNLLTTLTNTRIPG